MKYLILAFGNEEDWVVLTKEEQEKLLAQDEVLRQRGDYVAAVQPEVTTVRAWDGTPHVTHEPSAKGPAGLAGFGIIEAESIDEAIALVKDSPCARAKGAVEIRPILGT
jgi:hypothetical protein